MANKSKILVGAVLGALIAGCAHEAPLPPKAIELNREGAAAIASGDLATAEARIALALEYNPRFVEAWVNRGLIELRRGAFELARKDLERARGLNPDIPAPHHGLGLLAETLHDSAGAEEHYRDALGVDPGFAPARVNLGRILYARAQFEEAREQFFRATEVAPESLEGWVGLCGTLLRLNRDEEAADQLALARKRFGDIAPLVVIRARVLMQAERFDEAESLLVSATDARDPMHAADAWAWLAVARLGKGELGAALNAARQARAIDPNNGVASYALSQTSRLIAH